MMCHEFSGSHRTGVLDTNCLAMNLTKITKKAGFYYFRNIRSIHCEKKKIARVGYNNAG